MLGIIGKNLVHQFQTDSDKSGLKMMFRSKSGDCIFFNDEGYASKAPASIFIGKGKEQALFVRGEIYNLETLGCRKHSCLAEALWDFYQRRGDQIFKELNGAFIIAIWDGFLKKAILVRDKIGILQGFYAEKGSDLVIGVSPARIQKVIFPGVILHSPAMVQYLLYCYNPGIDSLYANVYRLRPAHCLIHENSNLKLQPYWAIEFESDHSKSEEYWGKAIRETLGKAVRIRHASEKTGAFLSGGLDSSSIVSILRKQSADVLSTFSFRCKGESFDESHYAKIVADTYGTEHHVVEYAAEDILKTELMVALMDEPFCDVGVNVATYLLAQAAQGQINYIFTGDGGDELFAGHPVYSADKMSRFFRWIPFFIRGPMFALGRRMRDTEQKKDWKVKLKRFSESYSFPEALGTQRWRIYYTMKELSVLLSSDLLESVDLDEIYHPMIVYNEEANGPDALSRSLYADYQTVVQFYLRRMEMPRAFGLSPRFPMLDPEIVELCARIPSKYKIRGWNDAKHIEKSAVKSLLPKQIVNRKDKLGHSIPMKNWIRDHQQAKSFVADLISESILKKRGLFNPSFVQKMWDEHQSKIRNHSHRLWALAVLELWMREKKI